ncbi:acyltransferase [Oryzomonas rubra]|uniref:Acyltransferase n=2 Tax=Oryzomonas rubra TaxID=2509454 RepID=A0A5A9XK89_9BACT|nr:acyltransferase [Oryzomonas rubra]
MLPGFNLDLRNPIREKKYLRIGDDCMINGNFVFESEGGEVSIGDRVYLGGGTVICRSKIEFGNDIFVAWGGYLYDHDSHSLDYRQRHLDMSRQLEDYRNGKNFILSKDWSVVNSKPIVIQDNVWIGMHCIILKGVTIGEGAIIGAGSVVTRDVEPWTVVAGNPAKLVKNLPADIRK